MTLATAGIPRHTTAAHAARIALLYSRSGVSSGLVVLAATLNVLDRVALTPEDEVLGMAHALRHIAGDISARMAKRPEWPLPEPLPSTERLKDWFLAFLEERETAGAERCLRTLLAQPGTASEALSWLLIAATQHVFLSTGHVVDFLNKARELSSHLAQDPATVAEALVGMLLPIADGFRHEEDLDWQDLLPVLDEAESVPSTAPALTVDLLLGDNPRAIALALAGAFHGGTPVVALAPLQAQAAVRRLGRFPVQNADDWDAVHHLVTNANGVLGLAEALGGQNPETDHALFRAVLHSALYSYLNRFLNLPRHYLPGENRAIRTPDGLAATRAGWMEAMANGLIDDAAWRAAELLQREPRPLVEAGWVRAVWHEDAGFHALQALDAALSLEHRLERELLGHWPLLAGIRFTTAQRDRRLVQWETETALKLARGEQLIDPE